MRRSFNHPSAGAGQFALRFRLLMSYHDLTLRDIALGTRCAVSTVGTWKNGRMPSSARVRERLAEIFHVSVEYLLEGRPAGREGGDGVGPEALAGRVLEDLELLMRVLETHAGPAQAVREIGREAGVEKGNEGNEGNEGNGRRGSGKKRVGGGVCAGRVGAGRVGSGRVMRAEVEQYVRAYLDRAEREPGGLGHAWVQLRREFPLDLYERLT